MKRGDHFHADPRTQFFLALNATASVLEAQGMSLDDYNYDNKGVANIMQKQMEAVKFLGISVGLRITNRTFFSPRKLCTL